MKRSRLKRTRLKPRSKKRQGEDDAYLEARMRVNMRDMGRCQAAALVPHIRCAGENQPHHVHPTGNGGPRCDDLNVLTICGRHHSWIHEDRPAAARLGLLAGGRFGTYEAACERRAAAVR